jgi:hypothetical protein
MERNKNNINIVQKTIGELVQNAQQKNQNGAEI